MKEFIYQELGIGLEQEEKLIIEENDLKFSIALDDEDSRESIYDVPEEHVTESISSQKYSLDDQIHWKMTLTT